MVQQTGRTDEKEYLPLETQQAHHSGPWYNSMTSLLSAPRLTTTEPLPALEPSPLFRSITSALLPLVTSAHFQAAASAASHFLSSLAALSALSCLRRSATSSHLTHLRCHATTAEHWVVKSSRACWYAASSGYSSSTGAAGVGNFNMASA